MSDLVLGDALEAILDHRGRTPRKMGGEFTAVGVPVASALLVKNGRLDLSSARCISYDMYARWMPTPLKRGDVLLTSEGPLGHCAIIDTDKPIALGQRLFGLRGKRGVLDSRYLYYVLQSREVQDRLYSRATGTTVLGIRQSELLKVTVPDPGYHQQVKIAAILGVLDDKITANNRIVAGCADLCEAHYRRATYGVTATTCLGDVLDLKYGKALPSAQRRLGEVPVFGSGGVVGTHTQALVAGPGIVVGRKGTVGTVFWAGKDFFPIDTTFYVVPTSAAPIEFLYFALRGLRLNEMNADSAVPGLSRATALDCRIPLPSATVMEQFADLVKCIFARIDAVERESHALAGLRDTLLPKLMSGELRVREAERVVSDAV